MLVFQGILMLILIILDKQTFKIFQETSDFCLLFSHTKFPIQKYFWT